MSGLVTEARLLATKVVLFAVIVSLAIAASFLLLEPIVAVLLTPDVTLENLLVEMVGTVVLASAAMVFANVYASLLCSLGRVGKATFTLLLCRVLIVLPLSAVAVFRYNYDARAVAGAVAVGYGVATAIMARSVDFRGAPDSLELIKTNTGRTEKEGHYQQEFYDDSSFSGSDVDSYQASTEKQTVTASMTQLSTAISSQTSERLTF